MSKVTRKKLEKKSKEEAKTIILAARNAGKVGEKRAAKIKAIKATKIQKYQKQLHTPEKLLKSAIRRSRDMRRINITEKRLTSLEAQRAAQLLVQSSSGTLAATSMPRNSKMLVSAKLSNEVAKKKFDLVKKKSKFAATLSKDFMKDESSKLFLVIRNSLRNASYKAQRVLKQLQLVEPYSCVLLKNSFDNKVDLNMILPFVIFGTPSKKLIQQLFLKRGRIMDTKTQCYQYLHDNNVIESHFESFGILCIQDLVDEIYSVGAAFDEIVVAAGHLQLCNMKKIEGIFHKDKKFGFIGNQIEKYTAKIL